MDGIELYALAGERTRRTIERFVEAFGPIGPPTPPAPPGSPEPGAFPYPQFDVVPTRTFATIDPLLDFLEATPDAAYALYWPAADAPAWPRPLMAFFAADGALVLGAVVDPARVRPALTRLADDFGARHGRTDTMLPPESDSAGFVAACRAATGTRLVDGVVIDG